VHGSAAQVGGPPRFERVSRGRPGQRPIEDEPDRLEEALLETLRERDISGDIDHRIPRLILLANAHLELVNRELLRFGLSSLIGADRRW
jgi:hypothetical protein